ncbi:hypothetical protein Y032_0002g1050 [Ancylostoma ceylanicum]|uniref:Uncharacterized protein n=1 Tax=Ancylostoma ceylanicum TaxID=53326 RepID=A0A016W117_9BILA|nr:hypothetical protein Y032_0002g1050 [Ancylostoma ceylanicum]
MDSQEQAVYAGMTIGSLICIAPVATFRHDSLIGHAHCGRRYKYGRSFTRPVHLEIAAVREEQFDVAACADILPGR